jgi:signal transduction histidine kinase
MTSSTEAAFSVVGSFDRFMEHLPAAFAVTRGEHHTLVFANAAFRKMLTVDGRVSMGDPIGGLFALPERDELNALMDRAFRSGVVSRNRVVEQESDGVFPLRCTVWPDVDPSGKTTQLLIELRAATQDEQKLGLQRRVAERLLLSAMREQDAAVAAQASFMEATFLAAEGRRLSESLDEAVTLSAMKRMSLPRLGVWSIVDVLDEDETMRRLPIVHPDSEKQAILEGLNDRWQPVVEDGFGLAAVLRNGSKTVVLDDAEAALASASRDPEIVGALRSLGVGALLTAPLIIRERLVGAVTFVGDARGHHVTPQDIALAEDLASRSAVALDRARLHGDVVSSRLKAESANRAKSTFLGMMSHELRTPLNAIGGYVDLLDLELRGPVNAAQHADLARVRNSQRYLLGLINDLLNLTRVGGEHVAYDMVDLDICEVLSSCVAMLEPLFAQKRLTFDGVHCDRPLGMHTDREKAMQIVVNLVSNAIKFTPAGGHVSIRAEETEKAVLVHVSDTGMGIEADKLESIFEPFVQLHAGLTGTEGGTGLGLAISRDLARAMDGDLTVASASGKGSSFTLTLPRAISSHWTTEMTNSADGHRERLELAKERSPSPGGIAGGYYVQPSGDRRDADAR